MRLPKSWPHSRLTRGLQLDLEIAPGGVPAKTSPTNVFSAAEDSLKRRVARSKVFYLIRPQYVKLFLLFLQRQCKRKLRVTLGIFGEFNLADAPVHTAGLPDFDPWAEAAETRVQSTTG
jgi:hypothetical protein